MRIVSLLPSATEIVYALGLGDQLVGVSHECDFPPEAKQLRAVTRSLIPDGRSSGEIDRLVREHAGSKTPLYALDAAALEELKPDLIITQALCNVCAVSEADVEAAVCSLPGMPEVVNLEARTIEDVLVGIEVVAARTGATEAGAELVGALRDRVEQVAARAAHARRTPRVAFIEWLEPPFCCGHWNPELVRIAGGFDPLGREGEPARTIPWTRVEAIEPELIFTACCGFDVQRTLEELPALAACEGWRDLPAVRAKQVYVSDGSQYFSRPVLQPAGAAHRRQPRDPRARAGPQDAPGASGCAGGAARRPRRATGREVHCAGILRLSEAGRSNPR
jgi:iron complex transport system substrate-binding protein